MPPAKRASAAKPKPKPRPRSSPRFDAVGLLAELKALSVPGLRDDLQPRYGITAPKAFGVPMAKIQALAKRVGTDHTLAQSLWDTGWYEARLLAAYVEDPAALTSAQMDRWCRDFDNWAVVDTLCFKLFDRVDKPLAWAKVDQWSVRDGARDEFVKRAGLALLASLALHHKKSPDEPFMDRLPLVERAAADDRNFVKKGASWAPRAIGAHSKPLKAAALSVAGRLALSPPGSSSRWVGRDAMKALGK